MQPGTAGRLIALNQQFYQTFSVSFSQTRRRIQPGVRRFLEGLPRVDNPRVLDVGCGNGDLAVELARQDWPGYYLGIDFSAGLIEEARALLAGVKRPVSAKMQAEWRIADLAGPDWVKGIGQTPFDCAAAFAVLHHLPGEALRRQFAGSVRQALAPGGRFTLSAWQFLKSQRLASRIVDWSAAGFTPDEVDAGDYLLDWRAGGQGLRYVHAFDSQELACLAEAGGFRVIEEYSSDGREGNLGLYQVWEAR